MVTPNQTVSLELSCEAKFCQVRDIERNCLSNLRSLGEQP